MTKPAPANHQPLDQGATPPPPPPGSVPYHGTTVSPDAASPAGNKPEQFWTRTPAPFSALLVIIGTAVALDLAVQSEVSSLVGLLGVLGCAGVVHLSARRPGRGLYIGLGLIGLLATNLVLRTSAWVIAPTWIAILALLLLVAQAHVISSRPFTLILVGIQWFENTVTSFGWMTERIVEESREGKVQFRALMRGLMTALAIGTMLALLLAAADSVFASLLSGIGGSNFWGHLILIGGFTLAVAGLGASASSDKSLPELGVPGVRLGIEGLMGLMAMNLVLGTWCLTQLFVALGHADETLRANGLTRAEYARRGFFQLVVVAVVVVGLLNLLDRVTKRQSQKAERLFAGFAILATLETLVLVAVTYGRLDFYMDAFGLTMLRLSVACFLAWLAVVMVFVALRLVGVGRDHNWTAAASLILAAATTVGFGWVNPEGMVTDFNISRARSLDLDVEYLTTLSADSQPRLISALDELGPEEGREITDALCRKGLEPRTYGFLGWNLGHQRAEQSRTLLVCN